MSEVKLEINLPSILRSAVNYSNCNYGEFTNERAYAEVELAKNCA